MRIAGEAARAPRGRAAGAAILWAVLGGLLAYLLDPQVGRRRRAVARDRARKVSRRLARIVPRKAAYAGGRLRGAGHGIVRAGDAALGRTAPAPPDASQYLAHK